MNTSRHHADWLSLVEVSGPFVSLPVLLKVFPQGLDQRDSAQTKLLRAAYKEWQVDASAPGRQRAWLLHVLTELLGYPTELIAEGQTLPPGLVAKIAEMGETLRPDFALVAPKHSESAGQAHLLIASYPDGQSLDRPVIGKHWKANPATRMMELLHATGAPLGLITNGEQWMLVFAPRGETTGYASWYSAIWLDEPITLRAFLSLLGVQRFFGVASDRTLLALLKESAQDQQEVTDQLGYQVREAVEVLVQAFDSLDQDAKRVLLKGISETTLYEAALTIMMRLVFLFSAEERGLLHLGKPLYDDNYAVSTLMEQLQEVADLHGPQVLERRSDAWARLLATFRAVHGGVQHQDLMMPAYGGSLFDPDRFPFLEGRSSGTKWTTTQAEPLAINNRVVLHLLSSLQRLRMKVPGGGPSESRRISFRALGVEQIGHVYEGLLDHTAVRATEPVLGMKGTRDRETEIPLAKVEAILAKGQDDLIEFLHEETGRTEKAIKRALDERTLIEEHRLLIACGHDAGLLHRVRTFAGLIREDSFERPVVVLPGSIYVTAGTTRRSTGTHYTPPSLTEPIVEHALEPLVYRGPAEGLPQEQWQLKLPKEILELNVCDMAMGSGAFLVQACRYLSERLTESWENEEKRHPDEILVTPEGGFSRGSPSERLIPQDDAERLAIARRIVADRCLYGVDLNPMAVEMAKLSMWLITLDAKRPFTFLDHAFKCGDSLLGLSSFKQLEDFTLRPEGIKQVAFSTMNLSNHVEEAKNKRELLESMSSDTPEQVASKAALYFEAEEAVAKLNAASDVLIATELCRFSGKRYEEALESAADKVMAFWEQGAKGLMRHASDQLANRKTLHWPLAFPEVLENGGFNAFIGNPPFLGGKRISGIFGSDYREHIARNLSRKVIGSADYSAYFLLRVIALLSHGTFGLIATNTIAQGDTKDVGLAQIIGDGITLFRAIPSQKWPGTASQDIALFWGTQQEWNGPRILNSKSVNAIGPDLHEPGQVLGDPFRLERNKKIAFQGTLVNGTGFILSQDEANALLVKEPKNAEVIQPFLNGDDLNTSPSQYPSRWIINFRDWPQERAKEYSDCFDIVTRLVKPHRDPIIQRGRQVHEKDYWKFWDKRLESYAQARLLDRVMVTGLVSKYVNFTFSKPGTVFMHKIGVILDSRSSMFAVLQSTFHGDWSWKKSSTMGGYTINYSLSDAFETFPFPESFAQLEMIGQTFYDRRQSTMLMRNEGLTQIYNRFHDPAEESCDISEMRRLQVELDEAVAAAYAWKNLGLEHGFYETKLGVRYTISETSRRKALDLLLTLNHQCHAEERAEEMILGKQPRTTGKRGRKKSDVKPDPALSLFEKE